MAKTPGPPKAKAAAPAQFDMSHRERKGGQGRPGGPGRGRDEKRAPTRIVRLPAAVVDRGQGWVIHKIGRVDEASRAAMGAEYHLIFDGHEPLHFDYLAAARDRAKEAPPEKPVVEEAPVVEEIAVVEESPAAEDSPEAPAEAAPEEKGPAEEA
jgi:hypothetical protein